MSSSATDITMIGKGQLSYFYPFVCNLNILCYLCCSKICLAEIKQLAEEDMGKYRKNIWEYSDVRNTYYSELRLNYFIYYGRRNR